MELLQLLQGVFALLFFQFILLDDFLLALMLPLQPQLLSFMLKFLSSDLRPYNKGQSDLQSLCDSHALGVEHLINFLEFNRNPKFISA